MDMDRHHNIRMRAFEIWEREGRSGDPESHWLQAEREIDGGPQFFAGENAPGGGAESGRETSGGIAAEETLPNDLTAAVESAIR